MITDIDDALAVECSWLYTVLTVIRGVIYQVVWDDDEVALLPLAQLEGS